MTRAITLWFTGLPSSGKTTLAFALKTFLEDYPFVVLDGDLVRKVITSDLGYTLRDRERNIARAAGIAELLNDQGISVISSFITPTAETRYIAQQIVGSKRFYLVYLECSLDTCISRDVKGLYKENPKLLTGISQEFDDASSYADLVINTESKDLTQCVKILVDFVMKLNGGRVDGKIITS
jgi:adenylylsulfate kinase